MYKKRSTIEVQGAGGVARDFNIAAGGPCGSSNACHIAKKFCGNPTCNLLKRKSFVTSATSEKPPPFSWRIAYQKLGCSRRKYHARTYSWQAPSICPASTTFFATVRRRAASITRP